MKNVTLGTALVLAIAAAAQAQYSSTFEPSTYTGTAAGTNLTNAFGGAAGQDNWFNPVSGSGIFKVYTYTDNALGVASNPNGSSQFIGGLSTGAPQRAQHAVDFSAGGEWTATWDVLGKFNGTLPTADNLGSFSLQPSATSRFWQQIMQWGSNTPTATQFNVNYGVFGSEDGAAITFQSPGPAWVNVPVNHWIRQSTRWSFATNRLLSVSIQDITAGTEAVTVDVSGLDWYLQGGSDGGGRALPTNIRTFASGNSGNVSAWDNIDVAPIPAPAAAALMAMGGLFAGRRRR